MTTKDRIGSKYIRYGILSFLIFSLLISVTITVSAGLTTKVLNNNDTNNTYQHKQGDICEDCHNSSHIQQIISRQTTKKQQTNVNPKNVGKVSHTINMLSTRAATTVVGNITLITSKGQDWYQQGIYGPTAGSVPGDNSWGWTFFDETPSSGFMKPPENVIQRDDIFALLLDDGNNSNPISGANVVANVTYWVYNGTVYTSNFTSFQLAEDANRPGFYSGRFNFYGGTKYAASGTGYYPHLCSGCHLSLFGGVDNLPGYFPGNYSVTVSANSSGKMTNKNLNFEVTPWGCEDCHGSGNRHWDASDTDMDSMCYVCHSVNEISGMFDAGNPHQNPAHRNINCVDCHTNKGIRKQTFNGVAFINGGINNAPLPQYNYNVVALNGGTHTNLSCGDCHGNLSLPNIQGGYKAGGYAVNDVINKYNPNFTSVQRFLDYYIINVTGGGPLNINFDWETSNLGFYLYGPDFNPKNLTGTMIYDGSTFTNKPESYSNGAPMPGKWILQIYGYNLSGCPTCWDWFGELQSPINYTLSSTYPLEKKGLPSIPECNTCHNSGATGGAYTKDNIPNWNPGYAHADTNGDGSLDIQCRSCHNSIHNIDIKNCRDCHTTAPTGHVIKEPQYSQYTVSQCLLCHGDPHKVSAQAEACIECHGIGYNGANPIATTTLVNISVFNTSIHQNINDRVNKDYNVTNEDCWQCHYNKDMNRQNVRKCSYCHTKPSQWHGNANVTTNLTNLSIR